MSKLVWVEMDFSKIWRPGHAIRIFKSRFATTGYDKRFIMHRDRATCVGEIRHELWLRCKGECEMCAAPVTEDSGHMHERVHRGKGGEISLENSVFICPPCHRREHADRNPRFSKKPLTME